MTTSTYAIVHIPDNTPELAPDALGQHVTIRTHDETTVPCTGNCGELVDAPDEGDPYCDDCATALIPADVRAMKPAPPELVRDIAALPDPLYAAFWDRLLCEYLADPPTPHDIEALQDALDHMSQDHPHRSLTALAPTGSAAPPTRLAG